MTVTAQFSSQVWLRQSHCKYMFGHCKSMSWPLYEEMTRSRPVPEVHLH